MRYFKRLFLLFPVLIFFLFLASCKTKEVSNQTGTYYLYENGNYNKSIYIILDKETWKDDDNASGDYTISGDSITFYVEIFGSKEELYSGSITDGVMILEVLGSDVYYCKEGKKPSQTDHVHSHNYSTEWTIDKAATCTETGAKSHHCLDCNEKKDVTTIPATEHSFGQWKITKQPTETSTGIKERICSVCKYKETESIPSTTHNHTYGNWEVTKEPTIVTEGKISRVCKENNQHVEEFTLPKLDEINYRLNLTKKATCSTDGESVYVYSKDNQEFEFSTIIPKLDHQYEIISTTATCTSAGNTTYVCKNDASHTYSESGKALGHDYVKQETKEATCLESGLNTYICSRDSSHTYTEVVLAEHNYQDGYCSECNKKCNFVYEKLTDTTCKITKYTGVAGNSWGNGIEISIPSYIDGYQVVELEEGLLNGCFTSKLILPFAGLNLNPNSFEERFIGSLFGTTPVSLITPVRVFGTGTTATNYYLPNVHLKEVVVRYGNIPDDWLYCSDRLNINKLSISSNAKRIGNNAFSNINLLEFVLPETIEEIGDNAFSGVFSRLIGGEFPYVSFNFPTSLKKIGNNAFSGNTFLKEITFEEGLESIGNSAFSNCVSLNQKLLLPKSIKEIADNAFSGCD